MHEALEAQFESTFGFTSIRGYRTVLEAFLRVYRPLERELALAWQPGWPIDLVGRQKTGWIMADLLDLQHTQQTLRQLPDFEYLPRFGSYPEALGVLYVLEGSTLGGRVILRRVGSTLGVRETWAGRFFNGYGNNTGLMWSRVIRLLNESDLDVGDAAIVESSAIATFRAFDQCLQAEGGQRETRRAGERDHLQ